MSKKNPHQGGNFDDYLDQEGLLEAANAMAVKQAFAVRLQIKF